MKYKVDEANRRATSCSVKQPIYQLRWRTCLDVIVCRFTFDTIPAKCVTLGDVGGTDMS